MKQIAWLLSLIAFVGVPAVSPQWISYGEATRTARANNKQTLVLYGSEYCPQVPAAQQAFEAPAVSDLTSSRFILAYVDISTPAGEAIGKRNHVFSTPTLQVLSIENKEIWRLTSPGTPEDLLAALQEVINGKTYQQQGRLLKSGALGAEDVLTLADTYLDRGWNRKGGALLRMIDGDSVRFDRDTRRKASLTLIEYATSAQQFKLLPAHLAEYPDDMIALINWAHILPLDPLGEKREAIRMVAEHLHAEQEKRLRDIGYRMVVQFAVYFDHESASWVLPYAMDRLSLAPSLDALSETIAVAVLANQPQQIETAKQLVTAIGPADKIGEAIAEGRRLAQAPVRR